MRLSIMAAVLSGVFGLAGMTSAASVTVEYGPVLHNGHYYYLLTNGGWSDSEAAAVALGGHLVTINDASENTWVFNTFSSYNGVQRALWIGLNDAAVEGTFVWSSGEPVTYTAWSPGEPNNNLNSEDWAYMWWPTHTYQARWNDIQNPVLNVNGFPFHGVAEVNSLAVPLPSAFSATLLGLATVVGTRYGRRRNRI